MEISGFRADVLADVINERDHVVLGFFFELADLVHLEFRRFFIFSSAFFGMMPSLVMASQARISILSIMANLCSSVQMLAIFDNV